MPRARVFALFILVVAFAWLLTPLKNAADRQGNKPLQRLVLAGFDPYDTRLLRPYGAFRDAYLAGDTAALEALLDEVEGSYLEIRTRMTLAEDESLPPKARAEHLHRALELRIDDPLARIETRGLWQQLGELYEAAGRTEDAIDAYTRALPRDDARAGLRRLETNAHSLAEAFLEARLYRDAVFELGSLAAPSIEAPAHRALGNYERALDAFDRWLAEEPDNVDAQLGRAWTLYHLEENGAARDAFAELTSRTANAYFGLASLALRENDEDQAVQHYLASNLPTNLWRATDLLERGGRTEEALPVYLDLAGMQSRHRAEAAYRALVLAERKGNEEVAELARASLPENSYFGLLEGKPLAIPDGDALELNPNPPQEGALQEREDVLELGKSLARLHDFDAAAGELVLALYRAEDEAVATTIGQALQSVGEYRHSARVASSWLRQGSDNLSTWRLAYPRAYRDIVEREAERFDLEPELIWAVMRQESAFFPDAVSVSNAQGLLQVIPSTWEWIAELKGEAPGDPFDPEDNIRYGAYYLRWLLNYWDGDVELVITSYNGGQGYIGRIFGADHVDGDRDDFYRFIDRGEPRDYLQQVMMHYEMYRALYR